MPRELSNWLAAYADHTAISEAPPVFHFWTGVSVIAGALRRQVWIDQKHFQWIPNFYVIMVGPPGVVTKSTSMKIGYKILRQVPGIKFGPQSMTWQGLLRAFADAQQFVPILNSPDDDPNDPLLERMPMACITCDVSELGTFLKPNDAELMDFLIDMWDGQIGSWKRTLSTQDDAVIENPWLNIIGCTTPSWMRENFRSTMIFGGLTSRCIFVWGMEKSRLIAYPGDMISDKAFVERETRLIHDLIEISKLSGPMQLTDDAKQWGIQWYENHWNNRPNHMVSERFDGYIARKQTHVHKLSMILSAATGDSMQITKEMLELSDAMVSSVERDMIIVFDSITDAPNAKHVDELVSIIRRNKTIRRQTLWPKVWRQMDKQQFQEAIETAITAGFIQVANGPQGVVYSVKKVPVNKDD